MNSKVVPKIIGCDTELGNVIIDSKPKKYKTFSYNSQSEAAGTIQSYINGASTASFYGGSWAGQYSGLPEHKETSTSPTKATSSSQDTGRKFWLNGGCSYIDMSHYEICTPEVASANEFVVMWHAMLRVSQEALRLANLDLAKENKKINAMVDNTDRQSSSWGGHINMMVSADLHSRITDGEDLLALMSLASFQASSICFTGAGKLGHENNGFNKRSEAPLFQISQRADWFEVILSYNTTVTRPIVNSRDESLTGNYRDVGRLHIIFYDSNLCHVANYLKVGTLQIVLAMMEDDMFPYELIITRPLEAAKAFSLNIDATAKTILHNQTTAIAHQFAILEAAKIYIDAYEGDFSKIVPGYKDILSTWEDVLNDLENKNWDNLVGKLDWVTRREMLGQYIQDENSRTSEQGVLGWTSPEVKVADLNYGNLDPELGLFWQLLDAKVIKELCFDREIEEHMAYPPTSTRAWLRGILVALSKSDENFEIDSIDWDRIRIEYGKKRRSTVLKLDNPVHYTIEQAIPMLNEYLSTRKPGRFIKRLVKLEEEQN